MPIRLPAIVQPARLNYSQGRKKSRGRTAPTTGDFREVPEGCGHSGAFVCSDSLRTRRGDSTLEQKYAGEKAQDASIPGHTGDIAWESNQIAWSDIYAA